MFSWLAHQYELREKQISRTRQGCGGGKQVWDQVLTTTGDELRCHSWSTRHGHFWPQLACHNSRMRVHVDCK